jgi:DnaJ-class molecular chaperone
MKPCEACGGTGKVNMTHFDFDGESDRMIPVEVITEDCEECGGSGEEVVIDSLTT